MSYFVNPLLKLNGLCKNKVLSSNSSTGLSKDKEGKAFIEYIKDRNRGFRIDYYKILLRSLGVTRGQTIRLCFYGYSHTPDLRVNSVGFTREGNYYSHHIPYDKHHEYTIK
jgi:hypothetical protein